MGLAEGLHCTGEKRYKNIFMGFDLCSCKDGVAINQHGKGYWKSSFFMGRTGLLSSLEYRQVEGSVK